jgi:hypothetical protein
MGETIACRADQYGIAERFFDAMIGMAYPADQRSRSIHAAYISINHEESPPMCLCKDHSMQCNPPAFQQGI